MTPLCRATEAHHQGSNPTITCRRCWTHPAPERNTSYNVEDFAPLTGREEDWRFTPLKRSALGGLHLDTLTGTGPGTEGDQAPSEQVNLEDRLPRGRAHRLQPVFPRTAWRQTPGPASSGGCRGELLPPEASSCPSIRRDRYRRHRQRDARRFQAHREFRLSRFSKAVVVIRHTGSAVLARNVEFAGGRRFGTS